VAQGEGAAVEVGLGQVDVPDLGGAVEELLWVLVGVFVKIKRW
jgi:hypothetical protein